MDKLSMLSFATRVLGTGGWERNFQRYPPPCPQTSLREWTHPRTAFPAVLEGVPPRSAPWLGGAVSANIRERLDAPAHRFPSCAGGRPAPQTPLAPRARDGRARKKFPALSEVSAHMV
jgi:hypothetical protein